MPNKHKTCTVNSLADSSRIRIFPEPSVLSRFLCFSFILSATSSFSSFRPNFPALLKTTIVLFSSHHSLLFVFHSSLPLSPLFFNTWLVISLVFSLSIFIYSSMFAGLQPHRVFQWFSTCSRPWTSGPIKKLRGPYLFRIR